MGLPLARGVERRGRLVGEAAMIRPAGRDSTGAAAWNAITRKCSARTGTVRSATVAAMPTPVSSRTAQPGRYFDIRRAASVACRVTSRVKSACAFAMCVIHSTSALLAGLGGEVGERPHALLVGVQEALAPLLAGFPGSAR